MAVSRRRTHLPYNWGRMDASERLFGEIAVRMGVLTREQLASCIRQQGAGQERRRIGQVAVAQGFATPHEVAAIREYQKKVLGRRREAMAKPDAVASGGAASGGNWRAGIEASAPQAVVAGRPRQAAPQAPARTPPASTGWRNAEPRPAVSGGSRNAEATPLDQPFGDGPEPRERTRPEAERVAERAEHAARRAEDKASRALRAASNPPPKMAAPLARASVPPEDDDLILKAPLQRPRSGSNGERYLDQLLKLSASRGASDLHVHSNAQVMARIHGNLRNISSGNAMSPRAAEKVIAEIMTDAQWERLARTGQVDFAYEIPDSGRFRVNAYKHQGGLDVVFRIIPPEPPTLTALGLPERLRKLVDYRTGMVLCTGPAGCGKSSTLAALVSLVASQRRDHILTVEDPVEFVYPASVALVNQRQVITHTHSYASALKAALREDPDIIVIAELRDMETISLAMSAAETGHLVLGTLHTGNAAQTINRITSVFPAEEQEQARVMLAESLRAVISQRLVPRADGGGRVPALELLMVSTAVSNIIRDNKTYQLPSVMQTGKAMGMVTLDDSLAALTAAGTITQEQAHRFAVKKERFQPRAQEASTP